MVFNGEIYNYHLLRKKLEDSGVKMNWKGGSDTEVLLLAIATWGMSSALQKSVGMFAIVLWDGLEKKLYLARDRFGEKPLYYGNVGKDFVFGSELKALRVHPNFNNTLDRNSIASFLRYSHIPSPKSIYTDIFKLPAAHILCVDFQHNQKTLSSYWSLENSSDFNYKNKSSDKELILSDLHDKLNMAVSDQMVADVPVGAFLSGGIDSSLIVALMQQHSNKSVHTFSIGFTETEYDESIYARAVAQHLSTDHTELIVSPSELLNVVPKLPVLYDEPFGDSSQVPTFLVSQLARKDVTVALSGDGGDEVFGGYNRHRWANNVWDKMRYLPKWLRRSLSVIISTPSQQRWNRIYSLLEFMIPLRYHMRLPGEKIHKVAISLSALNIEDLYRCLTSLWNEADDIVLGVSNNDYNPLNIKGESIAEKMMFLDLGFYLPGDILTKVDRAAMGVSLETRIPFLNHNVVEFAWNMPLEMKLHNGEGKWALRRILENYLPIDLINRPKMGFGVPIDSWLRGPLYNWSKDLLDENLIRNDGYLKPEEIKKIWLEHQSGRYNHHHKLWNVLMFQAWLHSGKVS
jgi:asparagine synthase (glutamine-hydrolysing)